MSGNCSELDQLSFAACGYDCPRTLQPPLPKQGRCRAPVRLRPGALLFPGYTHPAPQSGPSALCGGVGPQPVEHPGWSPLYLSGFNWHSGPVRAASLQGLIHPSGPGVAHSAGAFFLPTRRDGPGAACPPPPAPPPRQSLPFRNGSSACGASQQCLYCHSVGIGTFESRAGAHIRRSFGSIAYACRRRCTAALWD